VQVRLATVADADPITALINSAFRHGEGFLFDRDRVDREGVRLLLEKGRFLVSDDNGSLSGCVYVELRGDRAYLGLLSVDPDRQNSGLGSTLMNEAERYCADAGCKFMDLQMINLRRELPSFYRNRGYIETGTAPLTPGLNPKRPCHFITMSKQLT